MRGEVAVKSASQILAAGSITELLQQLHPEKLHHTGSRVMLPMGCPQAVTEWGRVISNAFSWMTRIPLLSVLGSRTPYQLCQYFFYCTSVGGNCT